MGRFQDMVGFIERDAASPRYIEPAQRQVRLIENLSDIIATYNPAVIVKTGVGTGPILLSLAEKAAGTLVVVEPSASRIERFLADHQGNAALERITFIQGEFESFPIDYYKADLLVCIDYLDFLNSAKAIDEFRRAIQIDGILVLGMVVLHDDDLEGVFDDFMRALLPLHNDFYLQDDLKTVLDLNGFSFVKGAALSYPVSLEECMAQGSVEAIPGGESPREILAGHEAEFRRLYRLDQGVIEESYFLGVFRRRKPDHGSTVK